MKNSQKGFVVPLLVAIIALLVVGGGVYIYENKKVEVPTVVDKTTQQMTEQIRNKLSVSESGETIPTIESISPTSGPLGTVIDIKGKNTDAFVIFESLTDPKNIVVLRDSDLDRTIMKNSDYDGYTVSEETKIILKDPCVRDEIVFSTYTDKTMRCEYSGKLTPGTYNVRLETWERGSNQVQFTITSK